MEEKNFSGQESLRLINQMISQAKNEISSQNGLGWLLWGWLIFLASVATFVLIEINFSSFYLAWNIFGVISIILLLFQIFRRKTARPVRTYVDELLRIFDIGFTICIFVIAISINIARNPDIGFGYFLMVYAFLMLVQGGVLKFRPLIIGAIVNWAGAIGIFMVQSFKYDMLITAAAVFIGYIIPGFILRKQYNERLKNLATDKS